MINYTTAKLFQFTQNTKLFYTNFHIISTLPDYDVKMM